MKMTIRPLKHKLLFLFFYFAIVSALLTINYTGSYLSDFEVSSTNTFQASVEKNDYHDCPPIQPIHPRPMNNEQQLPRMVTISVYVFDANDDPINVSFYNAEDDTLIDTIEQTKSETRVSAIWSDLRQNKSYSWYAIAEDWEGSSRSQTWTFTTNSNPTIIAGPIPADKSNNIQCSPILNLTIYDYNNDVVDVTFYNNDTNQPLATYTIESKDTVNYQMSDLGFDTTFSWYVTLDDGIDTTQSPVWQFTTRQPPPPSGGGGNPSDDDSTEENQNPQIVATIEAPIQGEVNTSIFFNANQSMSTSTITKYNWSIDQKINLTTTTPFLNITFNITGNHSVSLTIMDSNNQTAQTNHTIHIFENETQTHLLISNISSYPIIQQQNKTVNITANIDNTSNTTTVRYTITTPDNITNTQNLTRKENTSLWYLNKSYNQLGEYTYNISAIDETLNQSSITEDYNFYIGDTLPPIIIDHSAPQGTTGDVYLFNISITDFDLITNASVLINDSTLLPLTNSYANIWQATITIPHLLQPLNYTIIAEDLLNQNKTMNTTIIIIDNDDPAISTVLINQNSTDSPSSINISCNVTDNISLHQVNLTITFPNNTTSTSLMIKDNTTYHYNSIFTQTGNYSFVICATDTSTNTVTSQSYEFIIS